MRDFWLVALGAGIVIGLQLLARAARPPATPKWLVQYFEDQFPSWQTPDAKAEGWGIFLQGANATMMETMRILRAAKTWPAFKGDVERLYRQWLPEKRLGRDKAQNP